MLTSRPVFFWKLSLNFSNESEFTISERRNTIHKIEMDVGSNNDF